MKARIENNLLIITLFNESEIRQASDFQQANNYKKRSHELSIRFDIDLRNNDIAEQSYLITARAAAVIEHFIKK